MSVATSDSKIQYVATSTTYVVPFTFQDAADLVVVLTDAAGDETTLTLTTDYTVTGGNGSAGTVITEAFGASSILTIYRDTPPLQLTSYGNNDRFPASSHERALDKLTRRVQELEARLGQSIRFTMASDELAEIHGPSKANTVPYINAEGELTWVPKASLLPPLVGAVEYVIRTSQMGAVGDSDPDVPGSGTDDTEVIQAYYDAAVSFGLPVLWEHDMFCLIDGIWLDSNTHLKCSSLSCGFNKKTGSLLPFLVCNRNRARPTYSGVGAAATITSYNRADKNITIEGGTWEGNNLSLGRQVADLTWHVGIALFGVTKCKVIGVHLQHIRTFAIHIANWDDVTVEGINIDVEDLPDGYTISNQDGVHWNGPGTNGHVRNSRIKCWDDAVAWNLDDGVNDFINPAASGYNELGPYIGRGDITDCTSNNIFLDGSLLGLRILSKWSLAHNITSDKWTGTVRNYMAALDKFSVADPGDPLDGAGNYGTIRLSNWTVRSTTHVAGAIGHQFDIYVRGNFEQLIFENMTFNGTGEGKVTMLQAGDSVVQQFIVNGLNYYESAAASHGPIGFRWVFKGIVEQCIFTNVSQRKETGADKFGQFIAIDVDGGSPVNNGIGTLIISGYTAQKSSIIVHRISGRVDYCKADNIHLEDWHPASVFIANDDASGTTQFQIGQNYAGPLVFGGFVPLGIIFSGELKSTGTPESFVMATKGTRYTQTDSLSGTASTYIQETYPGPSATGWVPQTL